MIAANTELTLNSVEDVVRVIRPHTTNRIDMFTKQEVEELRTMMPSKLNSLLGAFTLHHIAFDSAGKAMSRTLPNDRVGKLVNIRPSWRQMGNRTVPPEITVHEAAEE
jgi:hypothetical protein